MTNSNHKDFSSTIKLNSDKPTYQQCLSHLEQQLKKSSHFGPNDLDKLENYWEFFTLKKNKPFLLIGDVCNHILFIHKGSIKQYIEDKKGKYIIDFFTDGDFCTASNSYKNQIPAQKGFICSEDTFGVRISYKEHKKISAANPGFIKFFNEKFEDTVTRMQNRLLSFQSKDAKGRYELLLLEYPDIFTRFTMQDISNYLGIKPETLSRMRKNVRIK